VQEDDMEVQEEAVKV